MKRDGASTGKIGKGKTHAGKGKTLVVPLGTAKGPALADEGNPANLSEGARSAPRFIV